MTFGLFGSSEETFQSSFFSSSHHGISLKDILIIDTGSLPLNLLQLSSARHLSFAVNVKISMLHVRLSDKSPLSGSTCPNFSIVQHAAVVC